MEANRKKQFIIVGIIVFVLGILYWLVAKSKKTNLKGYRHTARKLRKSSWGLRAEVIKTVYWFADTDIENYGYIKQDTIDAFNTQKIPIPPKYKKFIK
jgi:hypothetical protein